ncbi:MAG: hypothetical protein AB2693_16035, partial [Candidatus Thiodiazotropha sp.]
LNMARFFVGIIVGFTLVVASVQEALRVGPNKEVIVGENITLDCIGSKKQLSYYIDNKLRWTMRDMDGVTKTLTYGFYFHSSVQHDVFSGHYKLNYENIPGGFRYRLKISVIQHSDNGIYTCSLIEGKEENGNDTHDVMDEKSVSVTVLNPVESMLLEMKDLPGASTSRPVSFQGSPIRIKPGEHRVHCNAFGSNPAPVMGIMYNEDNIYGTPKYTFSTSRRQLQYTGKLDSIVNVNASLGLEQTLICYANVPNKQYATKEVGFKLLLQTDSPDIICTNSTIIETESRAKLKCNITTSEDAEILTCDKLFWELPEGQMLIPAEGSFSDSLRNKYEVSCRQTRKGLETTLSIHGVKKTQFGDVYFVQYGEGIHVSKVPVQLFKEDSSASKLIPTLFMYIMLVTSSVIM